MKRVISILMLAAVIVTASTLFIQKYDASAASVSPLTGESETQEDRDRKYLASLMERPEVSFLEFKPGPFVKADEIFRNYSVALNFVRLHSPYSYYQATLDEVKDCLYDIHPSSVGLEEQVRHMEKMRKELSVAGDETIEPVYFNDEPDVIQAGKQNLVEVPKVIYHAYLNGRPYAVVIRFCAYSGEGSNMKLYQGYMTMLKDEYSFGYYHCSGLIEIQ